MYRNQQYQCTRTRTRTNRAINLILLYISALYFGINAKIPNMGFFVKLWELGYIRQKHRIIRSLGRVSERTPKIKYSQLEK